MENLEKEKNTNSYFAIIPTIILERKDIKPNCKLLYAEISSLTKKNGECWATNNYLAEMLGLSETSITELLIILKKKNLVIVELRKDEEGTHRIIKIVPLNITFSVVNEGGGGKSNNLPGQVKQLTHNRLKYRLNNLLSKDNKLPSSQTTLPSKDNEFTAVRNKVATYFIDSVKKQEGIEPEINYAQLTSQLRKFLKKYSKKQLKSLIDFYLDSDRFREHGPNLGVVFSTYTINLWLHEEEAIS
jgi:hypothetical protein